jgi:hypothetical protein
MFNRQYRDQLRVSLRLSPNRQYRDQHHRSRSRSPNRQYRDQHHRSRSRSPNRQYRDQHHRSQSRKRQNRLIEEQEKHLKESQAAQEKKKHELEVRRQINLKLAKQLADLQEEYSERQIELAKRGINTNPFTPDKKKHEPEPITVLQAFNALVYKINSKSIKESGLKTPPRVETKQYMNCHQSLSSSSCSDSKGLFDIIRKLNEDLHLFEQICKARLWVILLSTKLNFPHSSDDIKESLKSIERLVMTREQISDCYTRLESECNYVNNRTHTTVIEWEKRVLEDFRQKKYDSNNITNYVRDIDGRFKESVLKGHRIEILEVELLVAEKAARLLAEKAARIVEESLAAARLVAEKAARLVEEKEARLIEEKAARHVEEKAAFRTERHAARHTALNTARHSSERAELIAAAKVWTTYKKSNGDIGLCATINGKLVKTLKCHPGSFWVKEKINNILYWKNLVTMQCKRVFSKVM